MRRAVTDEDKDVRRDAILRAARRVFADQGFHATKMATVARAAGVSYGTVYSYFANKEALFHAVMDAEADALRERVLAGALADPTAAIRRAFEHLEAEPDATRVLFGDLAGSRDEFGRHLHAITERFVDDIAVIVTEGQRHGLIVDAPPRLVAFSIVALVGQLALRRIEPETASDGPGEAGDMAEFAVRLLLEGLRHR